MRIVYNGFSEHTLTTEIGYRYTEEVTEEFKNFGQGVLDGSETTQDNSLTSVKNTPHIYAPDSKRQQQYVLLQDEWLFANDWELTTGLRLDHYSDFGTTINPRIAMVWQTHYNLTSKFLYGSAFRAPSFGELYSSNNPVLLGNPNLKPEEIDTYEFAIDYRMTLDWRLNSNIYYYKAKELFAYLPIDDDRVQLQNSSTQSGTGIELEALWQTTPDLEIKLGVALQRALDEKNNNVADAPNRQLNTQITWRMTERTKLYAHHRYVANRHRATFDSRENIADYSLTDLTLSWDISSKWFSQLAVKNIFNQKVYEPSSDKIFNDYPMEKRSLWVTLSYQH